MNRKYPKLTKSAKGKDCTLRLFPYCNGNSETTVPCHIPSGSGWGQKSPDWFIVYGCSDCHRLLDSAQFADEYPPEEILKAVRRALFETWRSMIDEGLIKIG